LIHSILPRWSGVLRPYMVILFLIAARRCGRAE
jgi:hypothetical protein